MKKLSKIVLDIYMGVGMVAMAILAISVMFSVIMRYFFGLSWKEVSEFNIFLFAFTTFWGMGINIIKDEHVVIDVFFDRIKPAVKRWFAVFNYLIVLIVDGFFVWYAIIYTRKAGVAMSSGMGIPMKFLYGIMPVTGVICAICVIIRIIGCITAPVEAFNRKNIPLTKEKGGKA